MKPLLGSKKKVILSNFKMVKSAELDKITEAVTERVLEEFEEKLTESWVDRVAQKITENITKALELKFEENLRDLGERLNDLDKTIADHVNTITLQSSKIESLKDENGHLGDLISSLTTRIDQLENVSHVIPSKKEIEEPNERVEERTNRQLRQTLIIKGVPEAPEEKTWADTKHILARTIADSVHTTEQNAYHNVLNRVHRGRPNPRKPVRDIYANLYQWEHCEQLVEDFRKLNVSGQSNIRIEYKNGPRTTWRRNKALIKRKALKLSGEIISGYVAYPARLMVKRPGATRGDKYIQYEDFSKIEYGPEPFVSAEGDTASINDVH